MALNTSTLQFRRAFRQAYPGTAQVVQYITRGWTSDRIAERLDTTVTSVAAVRANLTRGTYAPYVEGSTVSGFSGNCNF